MAAKILTVEDSAGLTGEYCYIRREADGYILENTAAPNSHTLGAFYSESTVNNKAIPMTEDAYLPGVYTASENRVAFNDGKYTVRYCQTDGTIIAIDYWDVVGDAVGNIAVVVSDKTGFSLSATGADLILGSSTFVTAIVTAINNLATYGLTALNTLLVTTGIKASSVPAVTVTTNNDKTGYTVSTVSDKTGYSLSATGLDLILHGATFMVALATAVWELATRTITALPAVATDWLTGAGVKADAVTKIQSGLATPTNITAATGVSLAASQHVIVDSGSVTVSDKTGFSLSATGADLILKSSTFIQAIVAAVNEFATYGLTALNTLLVTTGIKAASVPKVTLDDVTHGGANTVVTLKTPIAATVPDTQKVDVNTIKTEAITCVNPVTVLANVGHAGAPGANNGAPTTDGTKLNQTVDLVSGQKIAATVAPADCSGNLPAEVKSIDNIDFPAAQKDSLNKALVAKHG